MPKETTRKGRFSEAFIKKIPPPISREDWWDTEAPGLLLRVSRTGSKVFYWMGRSARKAVRAKIGEYPKCSINEARNEARRMASEAPRGLKPKPVSDIAAEMSIHQLWQWWLNNHAKPHRKDWRRDKSNYDTKLIGLAARKVSSITPSEIQELHIEIGESRGRSAANTAVRLLGTLFRTAIKYRLIRVPDPTQGVKLFHQSSRERFLLASELPRFLAALEKRSQLMQDFILLSLYTGARRANVASMKWDDIDFQARLWRVPNSVAKAKKQINVVLSQPAIDILESRRKLNKESIYVLPSYGSTGHVMTPQFALKQVLDESKLSDVRFHDLRRTLGSWMAPNTSISVIAKQLGQSTVEAAAIYARLDLREVRDAVEKATIAMAAHNKKPEK